VPVTSPASRHSTTDTILRIPPISIGIPVFNGERYLASAVEAFLGQTFSDFELIICDNASTDRTESIGRAFAARDRRVKYVRNATNIGSARNYRRVFELATGKYFRWHAADDLVAPDALARGYEILETQPDVVLAYARTVFIDEHGSRLTTYDDRVEALQNSPSERFIHVLTNLGYCNAMYGLVRADTLRKTRLLGVFVGSDICFHAELSLYGKFREVPEFLFMRRFHPEASSSKSGEQLQQFYDPGQPSRPYLREWRHFFENLSSVARAPIGLAEQVRAATWLTRSALRSRELYVGEVKQAFHQLLSHILALPHLLRVVR
jgi:glycosyltransferase involved in cell wall biosynthesis